MSLDIVPFATRHLEAAAALLAARHRRDRRRFPALPARFASASQTQILLEMIATQAERAGVVAVAAGRVVGFMLGEPFSRNEHDPFASMVRPRAGLIPYAGHAATGRASDVYPALYTAIVKRWLEIGLDAHYVCVPAAAQSSLAVWYALGFGHAVTYAVRNTGQFSPPPPANLVEIRRAQTGDEQILAEQAVAVLRDLSRPPTCLPTLSPGAAPALRQVIADLLVESDYAQSLAVRGQEALGMNLLAPAANHVPALMAPERAVYLLGAYTVPAARRQGVGTALLAQSLRWAREAGYDWCILDYLPTNLSGARFWERNGFVPIAYGLCRQLDERVLRSSAPPRMDHATPTTGSPCVIAAPPRPAG
jgi:GNAT superfamily N-acetyltransferase